MTNLQLSEHYYAVVEDLERQHTNIGRTIEALLQIAKQYAEAAMREKQPAEQQPAEPK